MITREHVAWMCQRDRDRMRSLVIDMAVDRRRGMIFFWVMTALAGANAAVTVLALIMAATQG